MNPGNARLRRYLEPGNHQPKLAPVARPEDVEDPYYRLGTHPDLVSRLWDELGKELQVDCRAVFFGTPALIHPKTGIVFGFALGTHTYALRLPETERLEAVRAGAVRVQHYSGGTSSFDLNDIGDEWVFCGWHSGEERWCIAAFEFAGKISATDYTDFKSV